MPFSREGHDAEQTRRRGRGGRQGPALSLLHAGARRGANRQGDASERWGLLTGGPRAYEESEPVGVRELHGRRERRAVHPFLGYRSV